MQEFDNYQVNFSNQLNSIYENSSPDILSELKKEAWQTYQNLKLPTKKNELYGYLRLRQLYSLTPNSSDEQSFSQAEIDAQIEKQLISDCRGSFITFLNGEFKPEISNLKNIPSYVEIMTLEEAMIDYSAFLMDQWSESLKDETDPFAAINGALLSKGIFIYVPQNRQLDVPIQILNINLASTEFAIVNPRVQIYLGLSSEATIVDTCHFDLSQSLIYNQVIQVSLDNNSKLKVFKSSQSDCDDNWQFSAFRARLKEQAVLDLYSINDGSTSLREDFKVHLNGENCEANLNGLSMLNSNREAHTNILIEHTKAHCKSHQLFKKIVAGRSKSSFEGKIMVRKEAQKTDAFQLNNNLVLNDDARAYSKPNLEIFADDVKASHGSTTGQVDDEQLFYLKSRGFNHKLASNLLIYGFCKDIVEKIELNSVKESFTRMVNSYLKELN